MAGLITADTVKIGTTYLGVAGSLVPSGGDANPGNVLSGKKFFGASQTDWNLQTGTLANNGAFGLTASTTDQSVTAGYYSGGTLAGDVDLVAANIANGVSIFGVVGSLVSGWLYGDNDDPSQVLTTAGGGLGGGTFDVTNLSNNFIKKGITWGANLGSTGLFYGDTDPSKVLTTADGGGAAKGTYNAANLSTTTVKRGTAFGVAQTGAYVGYPGSGANRAGLTQAAWEAAANWYWFEDGNGDGDQNDPEDGLCVYAPSYASLVVAGSWNGYDSATNYDNTYIADYTCDGVSFPNGNVATYSGIDSSGNPDTTWNEVDCALCKADCIDGVKDLPANGGYKAAPGNGTATGDYNGPLTSKVLIEWQGTRLPTAADFFGFCGSDNGGAGDGGYKNAAGTESANQAFGNYGVQVGRTDEYLDLADKGSYEWLSEQYNYSLARIAGSNACSNVNGTYVYVGSRFRVVFRP